MPADPRPFEHIPMLNAPSFACPRCNTFAGQTWFLLYKDAYPAVDQLDRRLPGGSVSEAPRWSMSVCFACDRASVWRGGDLIWPTSTSLPAAHCSMPPEVVELYDEARAVAGVSRRAGAALARASLERLLRTLRPAFKGKLDDLIAHVDRDLSRPTARLLTALRHVGNKSLHVENESDEITAMYLGEVDDGIVELLFAAINDVTDELIAKPAEADRYWALLPEGVRQTAERKAAAESA